MRRLSTVWWSQQRERVLARDRHRCRDCGRPEKSLPGSLHVHHIIPDNDRMKNLVSLCLDCHFERHPELGNKFIAAYRQTQLDRKRQALALLCERFIVALYGQEAFPCDLIDGDLLIDLPDVREIIVVSAGPKCHCRHVDVEPVPTSASPSHFTITHDLTPEEIAKAF